MLLRRVIDHVKAQNWTAIALDFVIVVVGVFIGIQVSNWNAGRFTAQEAVEARARLIADLQNDRDVYAVRRKFYAEVKDAAFQIERGLSSDFPASLEAQWQFIRDVEAAGSAWPFRPSAQVYNELLNAGKLGLVSDADILRQMRDYYQDAAFEVGVTFQVQSPFRSNSRRLINGALYDYASRVCNAIVGANPSEVLREERRYFPTCPVPDLETEITETAQRIHASSELLGDIRFVMRQTEGLLSFVEYLDDEAETLIVKLEAE